MIRNLAAMFCKLHCDIRAVHHGGVNKLRFNTTTMAEGHCMKKTPDIISETRDKGMNINRCSGVIKEIQRKKNGEFTVPYFAWCRVILGSIVRPNAESTLYPFSTSPGNRS